MQGFVYNLKQCLHRRKNELVRLSFKKLHNCFLLHIKEKKAFTKTL